MQELFLGYGWPGNVRELRNLLERIVLLEDGEQLLQVISLHNFLAASAEAPSAFRSMLGRRGGLKWRRTLLDVEEEHIIRVLLHCEGNKSQAARVLGLSRQGLLDRLKRSSFSRGVQIP